MPSETRPGSGLLWDWPLEKDVGPVSASPAGDGLPAFGSQRIQHQDDLRLGIVASRVQIDELYPIFPSAHLCGSFCPLQ
jgi:hypothetical protein